MRLVISLMIIMFIVGMTAWFILYGSYSQLLADVKYSEFKTPMMKQIILKYNDCRKLDIKVKNVKAFVEKVIENYEVCGLSPVTWEKLAKCMEYFIVMLATIAAFIMRNQPDAVYACVTVGILAAMALHLSGRLADTRRLHKMIVLDMVDYLENSGELPLQHTFTKPTFKKLTGRAYLDFVKMKRCYEKIESASSFALKK